MAALPRKGWAGYRAPRESKFSSPSPGFLLRKLVLALALVAFSAHAGELFIGRMFVSDGGTISNATTGYLSPGCPNQTSANGAGACDQAFPIGTNLKLTIQCDEACCFSANRGTTDAGICTTLAANEKFPTSTGAAVTVLLPDGGTYTGGAVAISGVCRCRTFTRSGTE